MSDVSRAPRPRSRGRPLTRARGAGAPTERLPPRSPAAGPPRSDDPGLIPLVEVPYNAESPAGALLPARTPTDRFFVRSHFAIPRLPPGSWRLTISGAVDRPGSWSLPELAALPQRRFAATLECAGNGRSRFAQAAPGELRWGEHAVGSAVWEGVPLATLLDAAGVRPDGRYLVFSGADHGTPAGPAPRFDRSLSVELGGSSDALVATAMNGAPLSEQHGAPARLVVPGWYGMAWVKWLSHIEVQRSPFEGHFQTTKYIYRFERDGRPVVEPVRQLRVKSLIVSPRPGDRLAPDARHLIVGKAWSGTAPVARVEVDVGGGWKEARLRPGDGRYDWASWEFDWTPRATGSVRLRARATDASGDRQPAVLFDNDFQYGANAVQSIAVEIA